MPLAGDSDETVKARVRRDPEFREGLLRAADEALLRGETDLGVDLANLVSATHDELVEYLEDAEDLAVVRQRLADTPMSDYIPHEQVEAEIRELALRAAQRRGDVTTCH